MFRLSNDALVLTYQPEDGGISIYDTRRGVTWRLDNATRQYWHAGQPQVLPQPSTSVTATSEHSLREEFIVLGQRVVYDWEPLADGIAVSLTFEHAHGELDALALPGSFIPEGKTLTLAMPIMQGVLYDGRSEPFMRQLHQGGHEGFSMSMAGYLTDKAGLLMWSKTTPSGRPVLANATTMLFMCSPAWPPRWARCAIHAMFNCY